MLNDTPDRLEVDPRTQFRIFLIEKMAQKRLNILDIAGRTRIPLNRLRQIVAGAAGAALLSDLFELSDMFGISVDSFFL